MTNLVRASIEREVHEEADGDPLVAYSLTVQPGLKDRIEEIRKDIYFDANGVDKVELVEFPSGFSVTWRFKASMRFGAILPEGFPTTPTEYQLVGHDPYLNEFGYLYVGLYICGMLSRYYPDLWQKEIEPSSDLSICIEYFLSAARERLALLTLMELESCIYLSKQ